MKFVRTWLLVAVALFTVSGFAAAQTTNGTISGHVSDQQGLALPGVTINATSPNLQGVRSVVTSENGDYVLSLLPPGTYTVTFELSGFQNVSKTATLAPTQALPLDATLGPAPVTETVTVVGRTADVLTQTTTVATNFKQDLIATLPTNRDITSSLLMAPAVHPSGPGGNFSIAGAASFESLFLVNGVTVNENLRGQPNNLYIEDAVQETTIATAGISAEYGRFSGGVVNVVTKSGGNLFSGSFRDTMYNDNWRALTSLPAGTPVPGNNALTEPSDTSYPGDVKFNHVVPTYEYTFGGPIFKDHLWFFTAGRLQNQIANRQTFVTNIPYTFTQDQKRYEANLTYSPTANHRIYAAYSKILLDQINGSQQNIMDLASLYNASNPQDLYTVDYNGVLSPSFSLESRINFRHWTVQGAGSSFTDLINGTLLIDRSKGGTAFRYFTSTFCGVCQPEKRDNNDVFVKGSYFLSKKGVGSHSMVFGYDGFDDEHLVDNYQSGSNYRILGTGTIVQGTTIYPQFLDGSTLIQYNPLPVLSAGNNFRTNSLFYNDSWRVNNNVTLNIGVRWDKNHGIDAAGHDVAKDSAVSPRVGVVWDPTGEAKWTITASFGKYVDAIANSIGDLSSSAGNTAAYQWVYQGPQINANPAAPSLVGSAAAIQQVFNWCGLNSNGFCTAAQLTGASVPGVSVTIPNGLESPHALEYAAGISRQVSDRVDVRGDFTFRNYRDFYSERIDTTTGIVTDSLGNRFDAAVVENTNDLIRRYAGLTTSVTYRVSGRTDIGANYTLSRLWGNFDAETFASGPVPTTVLAYPQYFQQSWAYPVGDLSADQRHRSAVWVNYGVPRLSGMTLSVLETMASGVPYGAVGQIDTRPYVNNPGYVTPQGGATESYYFTNRDAFRTAAESRTDFAANYNYSINTAGRRVDLFIQAQTINLFNQSQLCGCGGTSVFVNGGNVALTSIGQSVLTNSTTASLASFNPFTTTPVQGVNWNLGPTFGTAVSRTAYTSPRTFRLSFGVRF